MMHGTRAMRLNRRWLLLLLSLAVLCQAVGCSRAMYRRRADREVNCVVDSKSVAVGATPGEYRIDVNPRSRMYDPYNPDCEPMPPDDPVSHKLMECVDCKRGAKCWKCAARTPYVENPSWLQYLPMGENGRVVLDQTGAVQLALLQSTDYQQELEELYLSALDVTFERFRFDTQFFGGSDIFFTADGRDRTGSGNSSSLLEVQPFRPGNRLRAEKLTATGGELVVGLANSLIWQFAGPDDYTSNTILDFAIVQPLLRFGGRIRVLERLTIAERALLANVRIMERYQRGFYLNVVTGRNPGEGPSRRGGFFGGSGLEGFTGVGGGGFGRVGGFAGGFGGGGQGGGFTGGAGAAGAGGYIGLLQSAQEIENQRANVLALRESVEQLQASHDAGRIDRFQVDLARQALYNAQSLLITSENFYQAALDNFKVNIGMPPDLPVTIRDPLLDRFQLLAPGLEELRSRVIDVLTGLRERRQRRGEGGQDGAAPIEISPQELDALATELVGIQAEAQRQWEAVNQDFAELQSQLPHRRGTLQRLGNRAEVGAAQIDPTLFTVSSLEQRVERLQADMARLSQQVEASWQQLDELAAANLSNQEREDRLIDALTTLSGNLLELTIAQARARLDAITIEPVNITPEQALAIASVYRRDWANARASLVDSWRLIYFNANDLKSDLNILFSGDIGNVGDNPLRLRSTRGRLRVGLQFDPPLTRLAERNLYRQSLIEYQQARRNYYQFRDRIHQQLRNTVRQIRLDEINFELRRAAVLVAISQVDLTQLRLSEPPQPGEVSELGATTARDLVQSLSDLLNVQNDFLSVWVDYEVQRLNLDFDLGIMELDPSGLRIEHGVPLTTFLTTLPRHAESGCIGPGPRELMSTFEPVPEVAPPIEFLPVEPPSGVEPLPAPHESQSGPDLFPLGPDVQVAPTAAATAVEGAQQPQQPRSLFPIAVDIHRLPEVDSATEKAVPDIP